MLPASFQILIYIAALLLVSFSIFYFYLNGKHNSLLFSFLGFQVVIFLWIFHDLIRGMVLLGGQQDQLEPFAFPVFLTLEATVTAFSGPSWLTFSLFYTNAPICHNKRWMKILWIPSIIFFLLFHFPNKPFILFLLHILFSYGYLFVGMILLIIYAFKNIGTMKQQSILLISALLLPLAANIQQNYHLHILHASYYVYGIDTTPLCFCLTIFIFAFVTFRYRFLNITPYAFSELFDSVSQGIIVVDRRNKIMNANASVKKLFSRFRVIESDDDISSFIGAFGKALSADAVDNETIQALGDPSFLNFTGEIILHSTETIILHIGIQPYYHKRSKVLGRIITLQEITEFRLVQSNLQRANETLFRTNQELSEANTQLQRQSELMQKLAIMEERNRFAREAHDTIGHTMTILIALLQVCEITCSKDAQRTKEKLIEAIAIARDGLQELRRSINGLSSSHLSQNSFYETLLNLKKTFEISGIEVSLTFEGLNDTDVSPWMHHIYRIIQEGLTNAVKHGHAQHITLILRNVPPSLKLFLIDDGVGCQNIQRGNGLTNMEHRVSELGGWLKYGSDGESGFSIYIEIPIKEQSNADKELREDTVLE